MFPQIAFVCGGCLFQEHHAPWVLPYLQETQKLWFRDFQSLCLLLCILGFNSCNCRWVHVHFVCMFFKYVPLLVLMVFDTNLGKLKNLSVIDFDTISTAFLASCCVIWEAATWKEERGDEQTSQKKNTAWTRKEIWTHWQHHSTYSELSNDPQFAHNWIHRSWLESTS